ncbi:hypothetical protein FGO68_gene9319 [Halteria grandinella]|uniref:Uncharacterized protein n=1 Tax=Halteria grandinella TaxID=5974 RepID=A0A8J8P2X7_HALGN|nr:hypothetical protein FGO68_gene9319 [Halteria grandinella]
MAYPHFPPPQLLPPLLQPYHAANPRLNPGASHLTATLSFPLFRIRFRRQPPFLPLFRWHQHRRLNLHLRADRRIHSNAGVHVGAVR